MTNEGNEPTGPEQKTCGWMDVESGGKRGTEKKAKEKGKEGVKGVGEI